MGSSALGGLGGVRCGCRVSIYLVLKQPIRIQVHCPLSTPHYIAVVVAIFVVVCWLADENFYLGYWVESGFFHRGRRSRSSIGYFRDGFIHHAASSSSSCFFRPQYSGAALLARCCCCYCCCCCCHRLPLSPRAEQLHVPQEVRGTSCGLGIDAAVGNLAAPCAPLGHLPAKLLLLRSRSIRRRRRWRWRRRRRRRRRR